MVWRDLPEDREVVINSFKELVDKGVYKTPCFNQIRESPCSVAMKSPALRFLLSENRSGAF